MVPLGEPLLGGAAPGAAMAARHCGLLEASREHRRAKPWKLDRLRRLAGRRRRGTAAALRGKRRRKGSDAAVPPPKRRALLLPPPPARAADEAGEASRLEVGLELLGDLAPAGLDWSYPLVDETWRCFAGYLPKAIKAPQSAVFFETVRQKTKWLQPAGRWGPLPLRTAWMTAAPCCCKYRYGGAEVLPEPYPKWILELMAACMPLCGLPRREQWPNSCNLNLYENGEHSVGWHADNESLFQGKEKDCRIISLSLGQTRKFELQCGNDKPQKLDLSDGDLCTMEGLTQKYYRHRVPKEQGKGIRERINLTWRWVVEHMPACERTVVEASG